jgi:hypothetical protein
VYRGESGDGTGPPLAQARYWVKAGDTVSSIAARLHVPGGPSTIVEMNQLTDPDLIHPGQALWVVAPKERVAELPQPFANPIAPAPICSAIEYPSEHGPPALDEGCYEQACRVSPHGARICHCLNTESVVVLDEPGRPLVRVPVPSAGYANLLAGEIDLDADGKNELVVAVHFASANGIGIAYRHVVIFDGADRTMQVAFTTGEWGIAAEIRPSAFEPSLEGLFLHPRAGDTSCAVAPASFERLEDPVLGPGNYFAQRLYHYRRGELHEPGGLDLRVMRLHEAARLQRWKPDEAPHPTGG